MQERHGQEKASTVPPRRTASTESNASISSLSSSRLMNSALTVPASASPDSSTQSSVEDEPRQRSSSGRRSKSSSSSTNRRPRGARHCVCTCRRGGTKRFTVASHSVRITHTGHAVDAVELRYPEIMNSLTILARRNSNLSFDQSSVAYRILNLIRNFWSQPGFPHGRLVQQTNSETSFDSPLTAAQVEASVYEPDTIKHSISSSGNDNETEFASTNTPLDPELNSRSIIHSWIPAGKSQIFDLIAQLCQKAEKIFLAERRVLHMQSPCFVLGDIHGNLRDLRRYERSLWPRAPVCVTGQYLFLGDYVDRGEYGVECVLYLFALKVVAPDRFSLLRGNHEVAAIQRQYTFSRECETKFGQFGRPIWKAINRCFDSMPLAAVVDDRIFCAHGGIPRTIQDLEELNRSIPTPLENPEHQSPASWEILWNDPITDAELIGMIDMERLNPSILSTTLNVTTRDFPQTTNQNGTTQELPLAPATPVPIINDGFIGNVKRGTAYFYSDQAVYHFLRLNRLTHIIRAHEVVPHGYAFHCDAKVITIFSSSRYCGLNNQAACVLVDRDKLRIMRLDTSNDSVTSSRSDFSL